MLHTSAVPLNLIHVLKELQTSIDPMHFALAGGTSLALRFGHRLSMDLDFFTVDHFDPETLTRDLGFGFAPRRNRYPTPTFLVMCYRIQTQKTSVGISSLLRGLLALRSNDFQTLVAAMPR